VTNVAGKHYRLTDAVMEPKPDRLPILVGAKGPRMMEVVARHADEWNAWSTPTDFAERSAALDAACAKVDRDPATIARSTQALFFVGVEGDKLDSLVERVAPRAAVGGGVDRLAEAMQGWADAGVDEVIVPDFTLGSGAQRLDTLDLLIEQVAPSMRR
jgi:alkanesulfonate monooxygenase SsuD/methylene tetrahydromethanopterin reductase-like flavin-dependent oxidoreductase (luciferase family)